MGPTIAAWHKVPGGGRRGAINPGGKTHSKVGAGRTGKHPEELFSCFEFTKWGRETRTNITVRLPKRVRKEKVPGN